MINKKCLLFDMDGVLINSMKYHIRSWQEAFRFYGFDVSEEELYLLEGCSFGDTIKLLAEKYNMPLLGKRVDELYNRKNKVLNEIYEFCVYDGMLDLLNELKQKGKKLALVTGSSKTFEELILEHFKNVFDIVVTADDVEYGKPAPDSYLLAVQELNVKKNECLIVEDAVAGIEAGNAAGIDVVAVASTLPLDKLKGAKKVFENHEKLINYLKKL